MSDRIALRWATDDAELAAAIGAHQAFIAAEILAQRISEGTGPEASTVEIGGRRLLLELAPAGG